MGKLIKITLSDEAAFYARFLVEDDNLRYMSVLVERLIMQAIKKRKVDDRPIFNGGIEQFMTVDKLGRNQNEKG